MAQPRESPPLVGADDKEIRFGPARKRDKILSHLSDSCHGADAHMFAAQNTRDPLAEKSFELALRAGVLGARAERFITPEPVSLFLRISD